MSASMAEGMVEVILDHRVSRTGHCACGAVLFDMSPERVATHAAEQLAANDYGKLEDAWDRVAKEWTANSPRLPRHVRNAVFELVFDVVDKFNFPAQNCGYLKDVVEIGDVCGDVEKRIVALLRARAATERGQG